MEAGTYGTCESCGEDIGIERLQVVPEASRCVACAK
jgi:RNA polymerase-binding transcription factor